MEFTDRKQENWSLQKKSGRTEFTDRKYGNWSSQIESRRILDFTYRKYETGVSRQKVGELEFYKLEFIDRKWKNWSLQIESKRTEVKRKKEG